MLEVKIAAFGVAELVDGVDQPVAKVLVAGRTRINLDGGGLDRDSLARGVGLAGDVADLLLQLFQVQVGFVDEAKSVVTDARRGVAVHRVGL